jgi:hypothetical protein
MSEFFVALDEEYVGCWNCNSNKKTYVIYDYYDSACGYWCKDCWYSKMTGIQMKFLSVVLKYDNGFFRQQNTKIGNIMQSFDRNELPASIDTEAF